MRRLGIPGSRGWLWRGEPAEFANSINCYSETGGPRDRIEIPAELLRDPIRNGSVYLEYGFNPWNRGQKAGLVAHLETELVRLTDLFRQDASLTLSGTPASGA